METYKSAWLFLVVGAASTGVWAAVKAWSFPAALGCFILCAGMAACVVHARTVTWRWRVVASAGASTGFAVVGVLGLGLLLGLWVVPVLAIMAACSPAVLVWLSRFVYRYGTSAETRKTDPSTCTLTMDANCGPPTAGVRLEIEEEPSIAQPIESMDDAAVCFAWRASYLALQQPLSLASRLRLVERRQAYLDALERRNRQGFSAWLTSGARAAGDPSKYIVPAGRGDRPDRRL